jgi:phosphoglycerate dehydrogenase-like enzyme
MPGTVVRWGRSAYETDTDLALERDAARDVGLGYRSFPDSPVAPDLTDAVVLVVTSRVRVDAATFARFPGSLVITTTSGWDHVDLQSAAARGITVARCPLARRDPVAEQTIGALVHLLRRVPALVTAAREGRWARGELRELAPAGLRGAVVHVVGLGVIGRRVAELLGSFGAEVIGTDPAGVPEVARAVELEEGLAACDAVTLHCSLNPGTVGLLSAERLALLRSHAVVVNTARGRMLDVDAAVRAVRDGKLRGLYVDVFPDEPWRGMATGAAVEGVMLSPHSAGYVTGLGARIAEEVGTALRAWAAGAPIPHLVEIDPKISTSRAGRRT